MINFIPKLFSRSNIKEFIKFGIVGAIGTFVNLSILYFLTEIVNIYYIISEIIAFSVSVINNYILNKKWTFNETLKENIVRKYFKYAITCLLSLFVNLFILFILVEFYDFWYIFAEVVAIGGAFLFNFVGSKLWTFNNKSMELSPDSEIK